MTKALIIAWVSILLADGLIATAGAVKLFRIWWAARDRTAMFVFLLMAGRAIGAFLWLWGHSYLDGEKLPVGFTWREMAARTVSAIPSILFTGYLYRIWGRRKSKPKLIPGA